MQSPTPWLTTEDRQRHYERVIAGAFARAFMETCEESVKRDIARKNELIDEMVRQLFRAKEA